MLKFLLKSKYVLYQVSSGLAEVKWPKNPVFRKFYQKTPMYLLDN